MYTTKLVTHRVHGNVLLCPLLDAAGLLHGLLEHGLVCLLHSSNPEVHPGADLLHLDAGKLLAAALGADDIDADVDRGLCVALAGGVLCGDGDDVLQAFDVDLVRGLALEEVEKEALCEGVLVGDGALKGASRKEDHGPHANGELLGLELRDGAVALVVEVQLQHVEHLVAKGADKRQRVRALLLRAAKDEEAGVVFFGEELDGGGVLEGVDGVLLGELLGEGLAHGEEVVHGVLDDLGAVVAAEEEACLWVLDGLGLALLEGSLGAGVTGFSGKEGLR